MLMTIFTLRSIKKDFGIKELLSNASFSLDRHQRFREIHAAKDDCGYGIHRLLIKSIALAAGLINSTSRFIRLTAISYRHNKYLHHFIVDRVNDSVVSNSVAIIPCKISFKGFNIRVQLGSLLASALNIGQFSSLGLCQH